jgi:predicted DNA repair protein MutK
MSGLLALLDDVAAIAKVAAASVDDVFGQAAKASAKAAGAVIDDAAVTPKYVHGFEAKRELPIIWRITKGSLKNKLLYLLPAGLLLSNFAPWAIAPLLMLGGAYLCFEGAEKVAHSLGIGGAGHDEYPGKAEIIEDPAHLEEQKAQGAIKTDFILSAEIMTIILSNLAVSNFWMEAAALAAAAVMITVAVYGSVALIVKADDVGLFMAKNGNFGVTRVTGRAIVRGMPRFLTTLTIVGTAAMLWVGGSIIIHGMEELGFGTLGHLIHDAAAYVGHLVPATYTGAVEWTTKAAIDGVFGLALGLILIPIGEKIITPLWRAVFSRKKKDPQAV